ncbi:MAG TPA: SRPBCC family protein [Solirubrobacterales bacterium]|nr:SRPBCC family protein [Solirubrobacterales bacterium]
MSHTDRSSAAASAVWALWSDPSRWPEWNDQLESGELEGEFAVGEKLRVKFRRGGRMQFEIVALEPERLLVDEARMPGARLGHEHRLEPAGEGVEITHRIYVRGALSGLFALLLGRTRMRESVVRFVERERELAE